MNNGVNEMSESINTFIAKNVNNMADYRLAAACLKAKFKQLQAREAAKFHVGDKVRFTSKVGALHIGTVISVNSKTVTVETVNYGKWRVSPELLSAA